MIAVGELISDRELTKKLADLAAYVRHDDKPKRLEIYDQLNALVDALDERSEADQATREAQAAAQVSQLAHDHAIKFWAEFLDPLREHVEFLGAHVSFDDVEESFRRLLEDYLGEGRQECPDDPTEEKFRAAARHSPEAQKLLRDWRKRS